MDHLRRVLRDLRRRLARAGLSANCTAAYRKFLVSSSKAVSQNWDKVS